MVNPESLGKIASLRSPSDFMGAVMRGAGRARISKEDILGALSFNRDYLGREMLYYWLLEEGKASAQSQAVLAARGAWHKKADFKATSAMVDKFGAAALLLTRQPSYEIKNIIAWINDVKVNTVTKSLEKYAPQFEFLDDLVDVFQHSIFRAKLRFVSHFLEE